MNPLLGKVFQPTGNVDWKLSGQPEVKIVVTKGRLLGGDHMRTRLFFKLWFGFIAAVMITIVVAAGVLVYRIADAGPEGIGREIGKIVKGYNETVH